MKSPKLVVPLQRMSAVEGVFRERIAPYLDSLPPGATRSLTDFLRYLVQSTEAAEDFGRWRMDVRTEGLRRHEAEGGRFDDCEW